MTIDTIKNVLMRILSINKNLNEDSLHNLLVASGWDESDIKEGLNIFRAYKMSGGDADVVSDYKVGTGMSSVPVEKSVPVPDVNVKKVIDFKIVGDRPAENFIQGMDHKNENIVSLLDTHIPEIKSVEPVREYLAPVQVIQENKIIENNLHPMDTHMQASTGVPVVTTPLNYIAHQSHLDQGELEAYNKNQGKPIFLVILDVVLFLVTLGLLIYILLS